MDNWKSKSSASLDATLVNEADYQLLYRAKSEMNLSKWMESSNLTSSLQTSLNCLPTIISPIKHYEPALNDSIIEENSLIWDNFQMGHDFIKVDNESNLIGSDMETKELSNNLCYFGDDYSLHLDESSTTESEIDSNIGMRQQCQHKNVRKVIETSPTSSSSCSSQSETVELRRSRRIRKKRARAMLNTSAIDDARISDSNSTIPTDQASETGLSQATTASASSNVHIEKTQSTPQQSHDEFIPEKTISYNSTDKEFELHTKESAEPKRMKINEMQPEDFYDIVKMCQSNIDCVITVLGADPNRILTVAYCQQMKYERYQKSNTKTCECKHEHIDDVVDSVNGPRTKDIECNCSQLMKSESTNNCVCSWISHTIAMILNFLIDCWNIFRNMKLYTYLCRVTKALFGSTRYVADHLKSKRELANAKAIKFS